VTLHFLREMDHLNENLISMGGKIEAQLNAAYQAVIQLDEAAARQVIRGDVEVDDNEILMEEECLKLLALYQPVATDLRLIVAVLKINTDLERIGDHAKNIAEAAVRLSTSSSVEIPETMHVIFKKAKLMLRKTLLAFVEVDRDLAEQVLKMDDEVDDMCRAELPSQIELIKQHPEDASQRLTLLSVCRQLERIGDHASNIAEDVIYMMSGDIIRHCEKELILKKPG
jgi:phosphate transport system protein